MLMLIHLYYLKNWKISIEKALKHRHYRMSRLAAMHNPDYLSKHAAECREFAKDDISKECKKRLLEEQEHRYKLAFQVVNAPRVERFNRAK